MKASEAITRLQVLMAKHGDVDVVYQDLDTGWILPLDPESIRAQRLEQGAVRFAVSPAGGYNPRVLRADECSIEEAVEDFVGEDPDGRIDTGL